MPKLVLSSRIFKFVINQQFRSVFTELSAIYVQQILHDSVTVKNYLASPSSMPNTFIYNYLSEQQDCLLITCLTDFVNLPPSCIVTHHKFVCVVYHMIWGFGCIFWFWDSLLLLLLANKHCWVSKLMSPLTEIDD